jgi:hypothetical protein
MTAATASRSLSPRDAVASRPALNERCRESDTERGHDVDPPRVEVGLVDDARKHDDRAQQPGDERRQAAPEDDEHGDCRDRRREVEEDESAARSAFDPRAADVVELARRDARIRDEYRERGRGEEGPHRERRGEPHDYSAARSTSTTYSWSSRARRL